MATVVPGAVLQPLEGLTVLDLTEWVAGPNCTKLLADFGARVVKIERPGGDPARRMGPFPGDVPDPERSGMFLHLNTNKESVALDPSRPEGARIVRDLAAQADVLVESHPPGHVGVVGTRPGRPAGPKSRPGGHFGHPVRPAGPVPGLADDRDRGLRHGGP